MKAAICIGLCVLAAVRPAGAVCVTGADWNVYYNLPDQSPLEAPGEYDIRDQLLARLDALRAGQSATLAIYALSASGTAGRIIASISNALDRSVAVRIVADDTVATGEVYYGCSLAQLTARPVNPLVLVRATNTDSLAMHHKVALFDYAPTSRWVFTASWNCSSEASFGQWNIALEINHDAVWSAYTNEMRELLAGRFHYAAAKSHAHDYTRFRLRDAWSDGWVRFAPYPDERFTGTNAQNDIINCISNAGSEIVFALNKLTRLAICTQLVVAANRGVVVHGVIPESDCRPGGASYEAYRYLTNSAHYAGTNVIHMVKAYNKADYSELDSGILNLVHTKYMVIDPWDRRPLLIHGSANWTDTALASNSGNDENILFLPHAGLARIFYAQFKRMTGLWRTERADFWCELRGARGTNAIAAWMTDTNSYQLENAPSATGTWSACWK